jgi:hypothetical protein
VEQDKFVVKGRVEIDPANMTVFVEGEGLAVLLMEHLWVEKPGRFYELGRLLITVEPME